MLTFMFPGQGSQKKGMGEDLFDLFPYITKSADEILGYSIKDLCLDDTAQNLNQTQYTQPALYVVSALMYLKEMQTLENDPNYLIGHSLGEYTALFAAGVFDFETGLKLAQKRGQIMSQVKGGGMAAVIGLQEENVKEIIADNNLNDIKIANYNSPKQFVLSGPKGTIEQSKTIFENKGAKLYIILPVSGAFHSSYMDSSKKEFSEYVDSVTFLNPKITVISNVTALPYEKDNIKDLLIDQITNSVKWTQSVLYLKEKGCTDFKEIGPGKVLTGLVKRIT